MADLKSKLNRAMTLYRLRGPGWLAVSLLGELPVAPQLWARAASVLQRAKLPKLMTALAGVHSNQLWRERRAAMERVARQYFDGKSPLTALEVGTWFGRGSTQVWLSTLPVGSSLTLLDSWKPYVSREDSDSGPTATARMDSVHNVAINSALHEAYQADEEGRVAVTIIRGESKSFLPRLQARSFDMIYIDGSHYYEDVQRDLREAKRLIRPGGLICGDDLDLGTPSSPEMFELARQNVAHDLVVLPDGTAFHPGVALAVSEEFGTVQFENGFWWKIVD